jgi:UDP-glucose:(heptosyl)LPS alpha-1,3-glucosyltransferase
LNVAFVLRRFATDGGTEKYVFDLASWMVRGGHEVHVYCVEAEAAAPGVQSHRLQPWARRGGAGLVALLLASRAVPLRQHDVVQGFGRTLRHHLYRAGGGVHEAWIAARDTSAWRRVVAALSPGDCLERSVDRAALRSAGLVVCNSNMAARDVSRWHGVPDRRIRVVRNGVDLVRFRQDPERRAVARQAWGVPPDGRVAMFLGHGFRRKGLLIAAEAFAGVASAQDRFVVIGRDAHPKRYEAALAKTVGTRLILLGPRTDPETWLPGADATLLPTLYDAAANTTLEAMACGVPAITSARDGNSEILPDDRLRVEDPVDAATFGSALSYAWAHGAALGPECRSAAESWPISRNGEAMERLYREWRDA